MKLPSLNLKTWSRKRIVLSIGLLLLVGFLIWQIKTRIQIIGPAPVITYPCPTHKTALQGLLLEHVTQLKDSSLGQMVIAIDDHEAGNGKYWLYKVDNQETTVGADAYTCVGNETITWELR